MVFINLKHYIPTLEIVISWSEIKYLYPINSDFTAEATIDEYEDWIKFESILQKRSKSRIKLHAKNFQGNKLAVDYSGEFVAIKKPVIVKVNCH